MDTHPNAGKPADPKNLVNVPRLVAAYYTGNPDPSEPSQRVAFGTSGHRGSSLSLSFNEAHILAVTQAICEHRVRGEGDGTALPRDGHPRPLGAGVPERPRGAGGERRRGDGGPGRRLHAHAGHLPRHPLAQPGTRGGPGRRDRDHPVPQPSRRTVGSSTTRRTAGRRTRGSPGRSRSAPTGSCGRGPGRCGASPSSGPLRRARRGVTTTSAPTSATSARCWTSRRSAGPASGSASTRWAVPGRRTGSRSPIGTA